MRIVIPPWRSRALIIEDVRAITVRLPLERPIRTSDLLIEHREFVWVEVQASGGLLGHGIGFTRDGLVAASVERNLRPLLLGEDANLSEALWSRMVKGTRYLGRKGLMMRAISAVDIALWDLKAKAMGAPLWKLLGGARSRVPAFVAGGYYGPASEPGQVRDEFMRYQDAGLHGAKINVGGLPLDQDLRRVEAARLALGDEAALMVDFNGCLGSAQEAATWADALAPFRPAFLEEPFSMDDLPSHRAFYPHSPLPIALGEDESGRWAFAELLRPPCFDVLRHDATLVGGVSEWLKVAGLGLAHRLKLFPHWFPEIHVHMAAAFDECMGVELIAPETGVMNLHHLIREPLDHQDGWVEVPEAPGLGIDWDMDAIERWSVA